MDITPPPEFLQAFQTVVELPPTPFNVMTCVRDHPELFQAVLEEQARILSRADLTPLGNGSNR